MKVKKVCFVVLALALVGSVVSVLNASELTLHKKVSCGMAGGEGFKFYTTINGKTFYSDCFSLQDFSANPPHNGQGGGYDEASATCTIDYNTMTASWGEITHDTKACGVHII